jgi:hypothetical protein
VDSDEIKAQQAELKASRRRLSKLKEQAAIKGYNTDPAIDIEIEDIESKIKELRQQIPAESTSRRQQIGRVNPFLQEKQYETLQRLLSLVYRMRDLTRDFSKLTWDFSDYDKDMKLYYKHYRDLENMLYDNRALIPREVFDIIHEARYRFSGIQRTHQMYKSQIKKGKITSYDGFTDFTTTEFGTIDNLYKKLVDVVQAHLGLTSD